MEATTNMQLVLEKPTLAAVEAEVRELMPPAILMAVPAAQVSCASDCIRARKRGKDNHAVIQERNEDAGVHKAALQGRPR